jgi:hypothetical protein
MSGKYGPKENSVITCDKFITAKLVRFSLSPIITKNRFTAMVNVLVASIAVAEGCDM